jgi:hypothetical protein
VYGFTCFCWCFPFVEEIEKLDEPVLAVFGPYEGVKMLQKQVHGLRKPTMYTVLWRQHKYFHRIIILFCIENV